MLAYPPAKKWSLVHQDKLTEWHAQQKRPLIAQDMKEYVNQVVDNTITTKRLVSLAVCLRAQAVAWVKQFIEAQGHAALTELLTKVHVQQTNNSAHTSVPTPDYGDSNREYDIVKCLKALMHKQIWCRRRFGARAAAHRTGNVSDLASHRHKEAD